MAVGLSVIIPCYNASRYIKRCLDSFDFSYPDYELIFIDDCSDDDTVDLIKQYVKAKKINAKVYINEKNMGPGPTRNLGIEKAEKEYISFVDIDDTVDKNYFIKFFQAAKKGYDSIIFDAVRIKNNRHSRMSMFISKRVKAGRVNKEEGVVYIWPSPYAKFYKTEIIKKNKIIYPSVMRGEDYAFGKVAAGFSDSMLYVPEEIYFYFDNEGSLVHRDELVNYEDRIRVYKYIHEKLKFGNLSKELNEIYFFSVVFSIVSERLSHNAPIDECRQVYDDLIEEYLSDNDYVYGYKLKYKVFFLLLKKRCFRILKLLLRIKNRK